MMLEMIFSTKEDAGTMPDPTESHVGRTCPKCVQIPSWTSVGVAARKLKEAWEGVPMWHEKRPLQSCILQSVLFTVHVTC